MQYRAFKTRELIFNCLLYRPTRDMECSIFSQNLLSLCIFYLSSRTKLVIYLSFSQNFHFKNVYILPFVYQGVMPMSKVTTRLVC